MSVKTPNFATMSAADLAAIQAQLDAVKADRKTMITNTYAEHLSPLLVSVIENETLARSSKSDWVGYGVKVPVTVEGHAFTVNVTITDVAARDARKEERELEEARAKVAAADAAAATE